MVHNHEAPLIRDPQLNKAFCDAIPHILDALWSTEYRGMWAYHRLAVAQMAEVSIEFGLAGRGRRMIEGILPQVSVWCISFLK